MANGELELDKETKKDLFGLCNCLFNPFCETDKDLTNFLWELKNSFLDAKNKPPKPARSFFDHFRYISQLIAYNTIDKTVYLTVKQYKINYHPDEISLMWITREKNLGYGIRIESKRVLFKSEGIEIESLSKLNRC